jgi:pimeloyl-ACP methyl ester carboxylesterase
MAPVARELAAERGILEPIQTANTLQGQVDELCGILERHAALPATLVGYSWGAWLGYIVAAQRPALVDRLVLVSSGAFEPRYVVHLQQTRLSRLTLHEQAEYQAAIAALNDPSTADKDAHLQRLGALAHKADSYDPLPPAGQLPGGQRPEDRVDVQGDIYQGVWPAAAEMRRSGELLALARQIVCPVTALHGAHDPSPAEGVRAPLAAHLGGPFAFRLLDRCGHTPWQERYAREPFYDVLRGELGM